MSASDLHYKIEALQQQAETMRSTAASPAQLQGVLLEALEAEDFRADRLDVVPRRRIFSHQPFDDTQHNRSQLHGLEIFMIRRSRAGRPFRAA